MSNRLEISLEDIATQLKEEDSKYETLQDVLDDVYSASLTASNIISMLTTGFTIPDVFKDFKPSRFLSNFMPIKYLEVSKEEASIHKYEKLAISNLSILLVSFNQAIIQNQQVITDVINSIDELKNSTDRDDTYNIKGKTISDIQQLSETNYRKLIKTKCLVPNLLNTESVNDYIEMMMSTFNTLFEMSSSSKHDEISQSLEESIKKYYYINLLEITSEFPEVKLWIDLEFQKEILKENKKVKTLLKEIKEYQNKKFNNQFSLLELDDLLLKNSDTTLRKLKDILKGTVVLTHIEAHHNFIEATINEELLEENDIEDLHLPTRKEIYIPQSYKYFYYQETTHKKKYLDNGSWSNISHKEDEDIGKELFHALRNPHNMNQPIVILGHPGAGKSMFSSQFASKLISNNEFVPFLIKLRGVDSGITDIDAHINKGIQNSISGKPNINWTEWAREFPDKIPVIILDGFDELLRASQTQLNDYIIQIQKSQPPAEPEA